MDFNVKLQELRKQKGLTQGELAELLFVSRTAVSKWESNRGYPTIDSLKTISKLFGITIDELLSGDELITIAEKENLNKETHIHDMVFGLLDCSVAVFLFLPFFGQKENGIINGVSLLSLTELSSWLVAFYYIVISVIIIAGILTLALQNCNIPFWLKNKRKISMILNTIGVLIFIISLQPYAATLLFVFLIIKSIMLIKK